MIYISGKINGDPNYKEKFAKAKQIVMMYMNKSSTMVINPAEMVLPESCNYNDYLKFCLQLIDKCRTVFLLDDWRESTGACIEYGYAYAKGKEFRSMNDVSVTIIAEVEEEWKEKRL